MFDLSIGCLCGFQSRGDFRDRVVHLRVSLIPQSDPIGGFAVLDRHRERDRLADWVRDWEPTVNLDDKRRREHFDAVVRRGHQNDRMGDNFLNHKPPRLCEFIRQRRARLVGSRESIAPIPAHFFVKKRFQGFPVIVPRETELERGEEIFRPFFAFLFRDRHFFFFFFSGGDACYSRFARSVFFCEKRGIDRSIRGCRELELFSGRSSLGC